MTYQETKSLTNIISTIAITGIYAIIIYQRVLNGIADTSDVFKFWALTILIFIPISIAARIIIMIIFSIINATVQTAKGEEIDIDDVVDERDKLIELKSMRISLIIFSLGFIIALGTQLIDMSHHMFFITLIAFGLISEIVSDISMMVYYRKGV
ncbi:MAG: hypothetical protein RBQ71_06155 [Acholeplasmataceae bacterium]|jgi:hypothetical protein|nr:hypothetical protein [Acholeplasmataceae bacterium]